VERPHLALECGRTQDSSLAGATHIDQELGLAEEGGETNVAYVAPAEVGKGRRLSVNDLLAGNVAKLFFLEGRFKAKPSFP